MMKKTVLDTLKQTTKTQRMLAGTGLALVLLTGGFFLTRPSTKTASTPKTTQSSLSSSVDKETALTKKAEEAVKLLEDNPVKENVSTAETAVKALKDGDTKDKLMKRVDTVKTALTKKEAEVKLAKEAEEAVSALEKDQVNEKVTPAQTAVDKVTNKDQKDKLQHRINLVKSAMDTKAQQVAQAQAEEAARAAQAAAEAQAQQDAAQAQAHFQEAQPVYETPAQTGGEAQAPAQTYTPPAPAVPQAPQQTLTQEQRQQQLNDADANFNSGTYDY